MGPLLAALLSFAAPESSDPDGDSAERVERRVVVFMLADDDPVGRAVVEAMMPREAAHQLACQTVLGATRLAIETGHHPAVLKDQVTSPGGTTIAGLEQLELGGVRAALYRAVAAATARSRELSQG